MKLYDSTVELLVLRTMVSEPVRGSVVMSKVQPDYFGYDASKEVYNRVKILVESGRQIPSIDLLRSDPILSDVAKAWLNSEVKPLNDDDLEQAHKTLAGYRQARIIIENMQAASEAMSADVPNIETVLNGFEDMISKWLVYKSLQNLKINFRELPFFNKLPSIFSD